MKASTQEDREASDTGPLKFTFILALEKDDPIARGPTVKAGVGCFSPFLSK